ncbi:D-2-hydroxyacid dehydrogenase [Tumidithrix elongata RA019]|uniref:D-2-hydroxyacid dehydrogenase n=1 Tax=Tumidithrix elongata BACA0141 TaxID=2716417 RepID=A0AAW9PUK0_9CYAN|nr:D-2-hydroxyacid dehydrogenase [Tumidithrix elongata RA019]
MKLLLPTEFAPQLEPQLASDRYPDLEKAWVDSTGKIEGDPHDAEVYFNWFYLKPPVLHHVLDTAPKIRWHQTPSAGVNHILTPTYLERDIILTNGAGNSAIPISEFVLTYILFHAKKLNTLLDLRENRTWKRGIELQLHEIYGKTILIIGAGKIGQAIAKRAKAFGLRVLGSRSNPQSLEDFDLVVGKDEWRSLLPEADYVVIATPLTPATHNLIDEAALKAMRPDAYLINIARGAIVDEEALIAALKEERIAGAALDTFHTEPLPPESPLWSLPNVFITPHTSASSPRSIERIINLFLDNLNRYRTGQPLRNVVDKSVGY